ncbi:MAG TPA: hypothetical protein VFB50_01485 [Chloroflexota bacterium]|nr:hypothetical protein [Chloroflexota bacterium]
MNLIVWAVLEAASVTFLIVNRNWFRSVANVQPGQPGAWKAMLGLPCVLLAIFGGVQLLTGVLSLI